MKNKIFRLKKLALLLMLALLVPARSAYASSSIYVALGSKTVSNGSSFMVGIRMNSSSDINAVQANISYPTDTLTYVSTSYVGSAFEIQAESSAGGGSVRIARGTVTPVSGDNSIAVLIFRAKVDSGSATISVSPDSNLVNNGTVVSSGGLSATVNFGVAPPPPPAPVVDTTPPIISSISVSDILQSSATINWKTNESSDSLVDYGLTSSYGLSISNTEKVNVHKLILSSTFITPKTVFHYRITSADASGNKAVSDDKTFTTRGYTLLVTVVDKKNKPISGVNVSTDGENQKTDSNGIASLSVTLGEKTVVANKNKQTTSGTVTIINDKAAKLNLVLEQNKGFSWLFIIGGGIALIAIGVLLGLIVLKRLRSFKLLKTSPLPTSDLDHSNMLISGKDIHTDKPSVENKIMVSEILPEKTISLQDSSKLAVIPVKAKRVKKRRRATHLPKPEQIVDNDPES